MYRFCPAVFGLHRLALGAAHDVVGEHVARALVGEDHVDRAAHRRLVELLAALDEHDELLDQPGDDIGLGTVDGDLVAAHGERCVGERRLDLAQVGVALAEQRRHEVPTGNDHGVHPGE